MFVIGKICDIHQAWRHSTENSYYHLGVSGGTGSLCSHHKLERSALNPIVRGADMTVSFSSRPAVGCALCLPLAPEWAILRIWDN